MSTKPWFQHLCAHRMPTKSIITTHGHCHYPQESAYLGVCFYDLKLCYKKEHFHLFVTMLLLADV